MLIMTGQLPLQASLKKRKDLTILKDSADAGLVVCPSFSPILVFCRVDIFGYFEK
jgi:hypothetical protein